MTASAAFPLRPPLRARLAALACATLLGACAQTPQAPQAFTHAPAIRATTSSVGALNDLSLAKSALQSGDLALATSLFEKALDKNPRDVDALDGLATALSLTGDLERARHYYEQAASLAPQRVTPLLGLARLSVRQRRLDEAISRYEQVLEHEPLNALASAGLGTAYAIKGDTHRAQTIFSEALRQHPSDTMLTVDLGLALVLDGELRRGANLLLSVTGDASAPVQARQDLALAYGLLGNDGAADQILMRDLPRGSTDDNLTFYKVVRARLQPGSGAMPVATLSAPRHIGVQQIALERAAPAVHTVPALQAAASTLAPAAPRRRAAMPERLAQYDPPKTHPAPALQPPQQTAAAPAPEQWELHGQTPLTGMH
ncbi:tetratricopeptide repeat protein [Trinickia fusca]|uniref:Uncharacterized protein n=1 Tax=Trinickia fusca TaxID=2419777 RepID=A0A494XIP3_9BURK|nr:tetratricopeptide repeat protein [Trinickia fusca]RKP50617.1 hypothetical protein D7S89_05815 [Trinickia fusca]